MSDSNNTVLPEHPVTAAERALCYKHADKCDLESTVEWVSDHPKIACFLHAHIQGGDPVVITVSRRTLALLTQQSERPAGCVRPHGLETVCGPTCRTDQPWREHPGNHDTLQALRPAAPTDDEIAEASMKRGTNGAYLCGFSEGAKWVRDTYGVDHG